MFQITPDYPRPLIRWLVPAEFAALSAWSAAAMVFSVAQPWLGGLLAAGIALFALVTLHLQQRRRRRIADVTLDFWRMAMLALLLALMVWAGAVVLGETTPELVLDMLFLIGFAMPVISGMSYKNIPFLIWLHLNNRTFVSATRRIAVPNMKQIIPERGRWLHFWVDVAAFTCVESGENGHDERH